MKSIISYGALLAASCVSFGCEHLVELIPSSSRVGVVLVPMWHGEQVGNDIGAPFEWGPSIGQSAQDAQEAQDARVWIMSRSAVWASVVAIGSDEPRTYCILLVDGVSDVLHNGTRFAEKPTDWLVWIEVKK